jgi:probable phosphoglycerate mutase
LSATAAPTRATPSDPTIRRSPPRVVARRNAVADLLRGEGITRIVSSPLLRARQTAEPLAERIGLGVEVVDGWAEADRHLSRYSSVETLKAQGAEEWQRFLADPVRYMGGDTASFRAAVLAALAALVAAGPRDAKAAVFCHGLPINVVLSHALGLERIVHFPPAYGSITRLRARALETIGIVSVNETGTSVAAGPSFLTFQAARRSAAVWRTCQSDSGSQNRSQSSTSKSCELGPLTGRGPHPRTPSPGTGSVNVRT